MKDYDGIARLDVDGMIATVTFTRPDRANAMDGPFFVAVSAALDDVRADASVRAVVLCGEGRHFCAGGDLNHPLFDLTDAAERRQQIEDAYAVTNRLLDLPQPVVAVVQGRCAGAATAMLMASDLRVAASSATFSMDFVRLGLAPDMGVCWQLGSTIGTGRALEWAMTGAVIDAARAESWGLVSRVVPDGEELAAGRQLAERLAEHPPAGLAAVRRIVRTAPLMERSAAFAEEVRTMNELIATADAQERLDGFRRRAGSRR